MNGPGSRDEEREGPVSAKSAVRRVFEMAHLCHDAGGICEGLSTGFRELDELTGGLVPGTLTVLAGAPSAGATGFSLCAARRIADSGRAHVLYVALDGPAEVLARRLLAAEAGVDGTRLRQGVLEEEDWIKLSTAAGLLGEMRLHFDDRPCRDPGELAERVGALDEKLRAEGDGLGLLIVDSLDAFGGRRADAAAAAKRLSKGLGVAVLVTAHLDDSIGARESTRPRLSDLSGADNVVYAADCVLFVHRDAYYLPETAPPDLAEIIVAKNRSGVTGVVNLRYIVPGGMFASFAEGEPRPRRRPERVEGKALVICQEPGSPGEAVCRLVREKLAGGFATEELLAHPDLDPFDRDLARSHAQEGYDACWLGSVFCRREGDRWQCADLGHGGGLFQRALPVSPPVLFDRTEDGTGPVDWRALAALLAISHEQLACWGDGHLGNPESWLVYIPQGGGLLTRRFAFEAHGASAARLPARRPQEILDRTGYTEGAIAIEDGKPVAIQSRLYQEPFARIDPAGAHVPLRILEALLEVFRARPAEPGNVRLLVRGAADPVLLEVAGEVRAAARAFAPSPDAKQAGTGQ